MHWISGKCYGEKQSRRTGWEVEGLDRECLTGKVNLSKDMGG